MARHVRVGLVMVFVMTAAARVGRAQELGGAGTVQGTVKDPTGDVMQAVTVTLRQPVTGLVRTATTDAEGRFVFRNVPPNPYHLTVQASGFNNVERDVGVRTAVPIDLDVVLEVSGVSTAVSVVAHPKDLVERDPTAHTDVDQSTIAKLPVEPAAGLNQVVALTSPGVVNDSNGFFHPIGDHAQTQFSIDNQPITDQQSRVYSNQLSPDAVQSMELITGVAPAEYGDKSSLVVHVVTKSGFDQSKPFGEVLLGYGSFNNPTADVSAGGKAHNVGEFVSLSGLRADRFLDPPEFATLHDGGRSASFFNRVDAQATATKTFHLNLQAGQSDFDVPNTYDQNAAGQAQHQTINSFNIAPGYTQTFGDDALMTANVFVRRDHVIYSPSPDPFADQPGTVSQNRTLTNVGAKADFAYSTAHHNFKAGGLAMATPLHEAFTLGFTDPTANSPCLDANGTPSANTALQSTSQCAQGLTVNPNFDPALLPFDLTRSGSRFSYNQRATIWEQALYLQDEWQSGKWTVKAGMRLDHYDGLATSTLPQPRLGVSYATPKGGTVLRASYGLTQETPYNENLLLSSGYGLNGLFGSGQTLQTGLRNEAEVGIQQSFGNWLVADFGYFVKHTTNGYDFNVLFGTPIVFPVSWDHSNIDGFTGRISLAQHGGLSGYVVMGHTNAIYSPPGVGGLLLTPPCDTPGCSFRIDHDQKFQQTTNLQYEFVKSIAAWAAATWQYESGLVASAIGDVNDLLTLTADQQAAAGVMCGNVAATLTSPITSCAPSSLSATRLRVPAAGTGDPLTNPTRVAPRNLVDLAVGADNLLKTEKAKLKVKFSVINVGNVETLYNFLSTFSGTHFVTPRAYQVQVGVTF
ncbi:MAG TPA: TonB-dependent receptor [Vicinamibacterales bacterium]|nr:TonB-dependent receptor [Vicinamibacterales bacterium]